MAREAESTILACLLAVVTLAIYAWRFWSLQCLTPPA